LWVDYTLTVAVSIAAGTAALTSAFPALSPATVPICLAVLAVITLLNLRGLGYAARAFLLPTMVFIVRLLAILAIGLLHPLALHAAPLSRSLLPARRIPGKPEARPTAVVVPVTGVSRLAQYGISVALSISEDVEAVTVVRSGAAEESERVRELQRQWTRWNPGVPLRVLRTEYASVARPIVGFVDRLRRHCNEPVIVLIPVALPGRLRYRFLHNHVDLVLTRELRYRPDVVVARVPVPVHVHGRAAPLRTPVSRSRAQAKASRGRYQPGGCARPWDGETLG
jgi:hypothetical protein